MRKKGIKIRVLTNSLKSNDVLTAYAGYNRYRKELLREGVELYELKDDAGGNKIINRTAAKGEVSSGLHAKIMVFDNKDIFVGSFNLDSRSSTINTEEGIYVKNPALAKKVKDYMKEGVKLENAYRLGLDTHGNITWTTMENGKKVVYTSEPKAGGWDMFKVHLFQLLPFENQL
jgi:putative cardiolipin synthase